MNKVYLLTGGNIGDRQMTLATAKKKIEAECGRIVRSSALYETAAWGNTRQSPFLNQALELETLMTAKQLIRKLLIGVCGAAFPFQPGLLEFSSPLGR